MAAMRDFLSATRERVLVYDGGMGATLEQFDLSLERDYKLPGRCHEALVLNRPDVIEGVHLSMLEAGAHVLETDTFQASRLKLSEWGLDQHTHEINLRAAQGTSFDDMMVYARRVADIVRQNPYVEMAMASSGGSGSMNTARVNVQFKSRSDRPLTAALRQQKRPA